MVAYKLDLAEVLYNLELRKADKLSNEESYVLSYFISFVTRNLLNCPYIDYGKNRFEACVKLIDIFVEYHISSLHVNKISLKRAQLATEWLLELIREEKHRCLVI